jgi:EF-P beta-lysylation protein EpmB
MIPQTAPLMKTTEWQRELADTIKDPVILLEKLGLTDKLNAIPSSEIAHFPLRVPQSYVNKMRYADPTDPLLRQVFPLIDESIEQVGFRLDPVGDHLAIKSPGMLQKYHGRALLLLTGACAIHCRYCFRRHFPYADSNPIASQWHQTLVALKADNSLHEVIFSGGDPLSISDSKLSELISDLEKIDHIERLRIHTRLPVVIPSRVTSTLINLLATTRLKVVIVIHANHANELTGDVAEALQHLKQSHCLILNQAVLLKNINDDTESLVSLSKRLHMLDVLPYYLHLLDPVSGASHFDVPDSKGIELIQAIRQQLPGYLVPRLVREIQGEQSKTILA